MTLYGQHPCPNRLCVGKNDAEFKTHFGMPYAAVPMQHVTGQGHEEQVRISFYGGCSMELTRAAAIELARRLPEAIAHLPITAADVHDAIHLEEGEG